MMLWPSPVSNDIAVILRRIQPGWQQPLTWNDRDDAGVVERRHQRFIKGDRAVLCAEDPGALAATLPSEHSEQTRLPVVIVEAVVRYHLGCAVQQHRGARRAARIAKVPTVATIRGKRLLSPLPRIWIADVGVAQHRIVPSGGRTVAERIQPRAL